MCQYVPSPQPTSVTKAASRKHDANTPTIEPKTKTPTWRESSNRSGPSVSRRTQTAPTSACEQLLTNQSRIIVTGTPFASWMARWAGNAARSSTGQDRVGASSSAASRMELGGHSVETGDGWMVNAKPMRAPRKYPRHTSAAAKIVAALPVGIFLMRYLTLRPRGDCVTAARAR